MESEMKHLIGFFIATVVCAVAAVGTENLFLAVLWGMFGTLFVLELMGVGEDWRRPRG